MSGLHFHPLRVRDVRPDTDDAVVVSFDVPPELTTAFDFMPGQYLTLRHDVDGQDLRRSYSICAAAGQGLRVGVRRVPGPTSDSVVVVNSRISGCAEAASTTLRVKVDKQNRSPGRRQRRSKVYAGGGLSDPPFLVGNGKNLGHGDPGLFSGGLGAPSVRPARAGIMT